MDRPKETFLDVVQLEEGKEVHLWHTDITALQPTLTSTEGGSWKVVLSPFGVATSEVTEAPISAVEFFKGDDGWYWRTVWQNGQVASVSESYTRKDSARNAAKRVADELNVEAVEVS